MFVGLSPFALGAPRLPFVSTFGTRPPLQRLTPPPPPPDRATSGAYKVAGSQPCRPAEVPKGICVAMQASHALAHVIRWDDAMRSIHRRMSADLASVDIQTWPVTERRHIALELKRIRVSSTRSCSTLDLFLGVRRPHHRVLMESRGVRGCSLRKTGPGSEMVGH